MDLLLCTIWRIHVSHITQLTLLSTHNRIYRGAVWHDSFLCTIWRISQEVVLYIGLGFIGEMFPMTHSSVRYDAFTYLPWFTHSRIYAGVVGRDSFLCGIWYIREGVVLYIGLGFVREVCAMTHLCAKWVCAMTHFCVRYHAFTYLTLLTHNTIYTGVVGHESFLCGIWGISDCFVLYIGLWFVEELLDVTHSYVLMHSYCT